MGTGGAPNNVSQCALAHRTYLPLLVSLLGRPLAKGNDPATDDQRSHDKLAPGRPIGMTAPSYKADNRDHARFGWRCCSSNSRNKRSEFATFSLVREIVAWRSATVIVVRLSPIISRTPLATIRLKRAAR